MATKKDNIYSKIMQARLQFLESNPTKSGKNEFQKFEYYELKDIVPTATRICNELGLYTEIDLGGNTIGYATMTVVNIDNPEEKTYYRIVMPQTNNENMNKALQETGASETYLRRYLYQLFLDIAENDEVDNKDSRKTTDAKKPPINKPRNKPAPPSTKKPSSPKMTTQPLTTDKKLTVKQKNEIKKLDPRLQNIISFKGVDMTMKQLLEELQALEEKGEMTQDEREKLAKQISTI